MGHKDPPTISSLVCFSLTRLLLVAKFMLGKRQVRSPSWAPRAAQLGLKGADWDLGAPGCHLPRGPMGEQIRD